MLADKAAHIFCYESHLHTVHTVNGKQHVHFELRKIAADTDKDRSGSKSNLSLEDVFYPAVIQPLFHLHDRLPVIPEQATSRYQCMELFTDLSLASPPPRLA